VPPGLLRRRLEIRAAADPGVGEEQIDGTERLLGTLDEVDVAGLRGDVGDHLDGARERVGDGGDPVEVGDDDAPAAWNRRASAAPMPRAAPVTTTWRSRRSMRADGTAPPRDVWQ
jgi:hypothetical protein